MKLDIQKKKKKQIKSFKSNENENLLTYFIICSAVFSMPKINSTKKETKLTNKIA